VLTGDRLPELSGSATLETEGDPMALMRFDPFRELDRLADQALAGARSTARALPMEALRRGDQFIVALDAPGMQRGDIDVTVERNVVEITGRRRPIRQEGDELIVDERPQGEFRRQLFLGDNLDPNKMTAVCDLGVLTLTIPVSQESKPRKVEIAEPNQGQQAIQPETRTPQTADAAVQ
jgi:HSP20 family protein